MVDRTRQMAIEQFSRVVKDSLTNNVKDIRLFGSRARRTDTPESDIDILILVDREDRVTSDIIMDVVVDINLEYDVVISPVIMTISHYANQLFRETTFFHALEQEGISL